MKRIILILAFMLSILSAADVSIYDITTGNYVYGESETTGQDTTIYIYGVDGPEPVPAPIEPTDPYPNLADPYAVPE